MNRQFRALLYIIAALTIVACTNPVVQSSSKAITAFSIVSPAAAGSIAESSHSIAVTVPFDTTVAALVPLFTHTGASVSPALGSVQDFTNPVVYTVTAADNSTQAYTVTVTVASAAGSKAIIYFSFATTPVSIGTITEATHSISVIVPVGTQVTELSPTITHTGVDISPAPWVAQDFSQPIKYTVLAADGTTQAYNVMTAFAVAVSGVTLAPTTMDLYISGATGSLTPTIAPANASFKNVSWSSGNPAVAAVSGGIVSPVAVGTSIITVTTIDGGKTATCTVTVHAPVPPTVTTTDIAGNLAFTPYIAGTSAIGGGEVSSDGGSAVIDRGLCWNTTGTPTLSNSHSSDGNGTGVFSTCALFGLTSNTTYYVRAFASNSGGTTYGAQVSFNSGKPFGVDDGSGYVFYNNGSGGGISCAKVDQSAGLAWLSGTDTEIINAFAWSLGTGQANTTAIVSTLGTSVQYAARMCDELVLAGKSDWYLPSWDELNLMYTNLKAHGLGGLAGSIYWSSCVGPSLDMDAMCQNFGNGIRSSNDVATSNYVRAVRTF